VIYGVTTGYGDSCTVNIPPALVAELPHHLYTYHGCGLGRYLDPVETRAVLAARLASLVRGMSGVSVPLLEGLATPAAARRAADDSGRRLGGCQW
jgi:histidine ammonia-lyase